MKAGSMEADIIKMNNVEFPISELLKMHLAYCWLEINTPPLVSVIDRGNHCGFSYSINHKLCDTDHRLSVGECLRVVGFVKEFKAAGFVCGRQGFFSCERGNILTLASQVTRLISQSLYECPRCRARCAMNLKNEISGIVSNMAVEDVFLNYSYSFPVDSNSSDYEVSIVRLDREIIMQISGGDIEDSRIDIWISSLKIDELSLESPTGLKVARIYEEDSQQQLNKEAVS